MRTFREYYVTGESVVLKEGRTIFKLVGQIRKLKVSELKIVHIWNNRLN